MVSDVIRRPWQEDTFRHEFRRVASAASIPLDPQVRDPQATAATELSDAGADRVDLSTHTQRKTVQMARRYAWRTTRNKTETAMEPGCTGPRRDVPK